MAAIGEGVQIAITTSVIQRGRSGVGQYVLSLVRALMQQATRHEFTLFVLEEDVPLFAFAANAMRIVPVAETFRPPVRDIFWHQTRLPQLARRLGLNVLHTPSYRRMVAHAPCAKVATIHDLAPFRLAGKYDWRRMIYGRVVAKQLARRQDAVIAVSDSTAADIRQFFGIDGDRLVTVRNGIDHARFNLAGVADAPAEVSRRWGLDQPYFLFVSRLEHPGKNHVRLIAAYEQFRRSTGLAWTLALGGGDWHGAEVIRARAAASPYAADIRFLGFVPDDALPPLYQAAGAMVYPSLFEGFGLPPIEAMASGCPVICSRRGALGEVVGDAARIVEPEDEASISNALTEFAVAPEVRADWRIRGLGRAQLFSWADAAKHTLGTYHWAAAQRRPAVGRAAINPPLGLQQ